MNNSTNLQVEQHATSFGAVQGTRVEALRFLLRGRDTKFIAAFGDVFRAGIIRIIKTPPQAPPANAICELVIRTLRREARDWMLTASERHLPKILTEYAGHYNVHRPHQSRGQRPPATETAVTRPITDLAGARSIRRQPVLNGLINQYHRAA